MILISTKQHLSNILSSIHEKVRQHWGWVKKKALFIKETCITLDQNSIKIQGNFLNLRLFHKYLIVEYPLCP